MESETEIKQTIIQMINKIDNISVLRWIQSFLKDGINGKW